MTSKGTSTSTSNGLETTFPPTAAATISSSSRKRRRPSEPQAADAAVERTHMPDDKRRTKRRTAPKEPDQEAEEETATGTTTCMANVGPSDDADDGPPSVDGDHCAIGSTAATKGLAGSPIAALPAEMLHAVLCRVDDLDLPACLFVCQGWAQTIAGRAAHPARALLPRGVLSQRLATEGQLGALKWARLALRIRWDERTCSNAARGGHLEPLQWARANGCLWDARTCSQAARGGHLELLQWARASCCPWDKQLSWTAAAGGQVAVLEWVTMEGYEWDHGLVCEGAAAAGHLHVLKWSLDSRLGDGCPSMPPEDARPGHAAALHGRLEVLQWLHAHGSPFGPNTCASAARGGHLEALQWMRLNTEECPWDDRTCVQAA